MASSIAGMVFNAELDEWQYQQPMIHSRSELTGVFFDQRIRVRIGGQNSAGLHRSVERFDFINRRECCGHVCCKSQRRFVTPTNYCVIVTVVCLSIRGTWLRSIAVTFSGFMC